MASIGDWFSSKIAEVTGKTPQQHADAVKSALKLPPALVNDSDGAKAFGAAPEAPGTTMMGGRRHRTRRGKKARKTRRRHGGGVCPVKCPSSSNGQHDFGRSVNLGDVTQKQCKNCKCVHSS